MNISRKRKFFEQPDTGSDPLCIIHFDRSSNEHYIQCNAESFQKLEMIRNKRLAEPEGSALRMTEICLKFPQTFSENLGYHRDCYQTFTKNLGRLKAWKNVAPGTSASMETISGVSVEKRRRSADPDKTIFKPDCIFCGKVGRKTVNKKGMKTTEPTSKFEFGGGANIQSVAEERQDEALLTRIRGVDLFACEAQFHSSCRIKYLAEPQRWRSKDEAQKKHQAEKEEAHKVSFEKVQAYIDTEILKNKKVVKLSDLKEIYISQLASTEFANPQYRSENLKLNLEKRYGKKLKFIDMKKPGRFSSYLVFSTDTDIESAITYAYELGNVDKFIDVAKSLRSEINEAFENDEDLRWPPTAQYLESREIPFPNNLKKFFNVLITGKVCDVQSPKATRIVSSIGQDICRAVTNGRWKLPKHIFLCMALRHWFRSAELTTLLNRLGHSETYSFSLELETAIAIAVENTSTLLSPQIVRHPDVPSIFHSDFDNYDQLLNDICGMDSVHTSHGIMLQDFSCPADQETGGFLPDVSSVDKTGIRSLKLDTQKVLPDCYVSQKKSPGYVVDQWEVPQSDVIFDAEVKANMLWIIARYVNSIVTVQEIPGFSGFLSVLGDSPSRLTTIDYYPVINQPITDNKAVQECLRYSEEGAKEVGQNYVITTFDLGVCMKAYPLVWSQPTRYENHIVMIGTFHVVCAYLKMVGKKMEGSGFSDILLEAGLIGSGSLNGVMSGKHYSRAMHCHKTLLEALERLFLEEFMASIGDQPLSTFSEDQFEVLKSLVDHPSKQTFDAALQNEDMSSYIDRFLKYRQDTREGRLGKTAQFWLSYMDHIWLVLQLTKAVKTNNFLLYARCLFLMCDLFFSFGGQNYARYLTFFSVFLANIEHSHPGATDLLSRGAISVARSFIPGNRCPVDKTIEETFMKHSKSHGGAGGSSAGLTGLLSNYDSYQRWVRAAHERAQFVKGTLGIADMLADKTSEGTHRDLRPSEIKRGEENVVNVAGTVTGFINPFDIDEKDKLLCLSSGAFADASVENDVLNAEEKGNAAKVLFIKDRLETNSKFFDPIKRLNLKTLSELTKKTTVKSSKNKVLEYRQQSNIAFQLLIRSQCEDLKIDLKELMSYPLTPVPYSIATPDGFLNKTDKSKGFHHLVQNVESFNSPPDDETLVIEDGNAVFYYLKELPPTFREICCRIFDIVVRRSDVVFSTDMYIENSVKSMERKSRGDSERLILRGENTKKPPDWKKFLSNDENKKQFIQMLCRVWECDGFSEKLHGKKLITVCEGHAYLLTSEDGENITRQEIESLQSTQEETDTRVILYCLYGKQQGYSYLRVKSPDTDIFFILLHYALSLKDATVLFDTGVGNNKRLINMTQLAEEYGQEYCTALLGLHAFTRCDSTSAFKGIGKVKPINVLLKNPIFINTMAALGDMWEIPEDLFLQIEAFTCLMYGGKHFTDVNEMRYSKLREKCCSTPGQKFDSSRNIDISTLPPCKKSLAQHIRRVNYQVCIWKRSHIATPECPDPSDNHGWHFVDGILEPKWLEGEFIPQTLIDVLVDENILNESEDESDGEEDVLYSLYDSGSDEDDDE